MKTIQTILVLAALFTATCAHAQSEKKKVTFGLKAGVNLSTVEARAGNARANNIESSAGFHTGVTLDVSIAPQWYLFTGAEYTVKGFEIDQSRYTTVNASYLQFPLTIGPQFEFGNWTIPFHIGFYYAYGLAGKANDGSSEWDTFSKKLLKKSDFGFVGGVGIGWRKLCFSMGGEIGLVNILHENRDDLTMNNINFTVSVGYKF
ncbi:MAG: outer membrane beta-barrel protein [Tannerella sp.]|uniref:outer membrane beta-barrel protein n=1 Tax=Tannerella sp. TaxID=2382127 RepID=UPI003FA2F73B